MRRFALFALFLCLCVTGLCQSTIVAPESAPIDKAVISPGQFTFGSGSFGLNSSSNEPGKMNACDGVRADQTQPSAQPGANPLSHLPCLDVSRFAELARVNAPAFPVSNRPWQSGKTEPIPTQWPNAKVEQIPTTWANLKLAPVQDQSRQKAPRR